MKKIIISIFVIIISNVYAQNIDVGYPHVAPMSPNAAELSKYADYPVSYYTGTPNVSIPIYEINEDGFKLPINLSYHASGIKVNQEATWVGLGWTLGVESRISRTKMGVDDFFFSDVNYPDINQGYYESPEQDNFRETHFNPPFSTVVDGGDYRLIKDSEPDIFYYNLPGMSGKFIIDKSRGAVLFDKSHNIKVEVLINQGRGSTMYGVQDVKFKITDKEGNQYFYKKVEITKTYMRRGYLNQNNSNALIFDNQMSPYNEVIWNNLNGTTTNSDKHNIMISSWCLSEIITTNGKEISFQYETEQQILPTQESSERYLNLYSGIIDGFDANRSKNVNTALRLKSISGDFGHIDFASSARLDIKGDSEKLESISIYNKANTLIKSFKFDYSYFNDGYSGIPLYENVFKRFKLNKVTEYSSTNLPINSGYALDYYINTDLNHTGDFPAKNSKNVDYWGFQNGQYYWENVFMGLVLNISNHYYLQGVKKEMNFNKAIIGTLKKITYPTDGGTEFTFEGHKISTDFFTEHIYSSSTIDYLIEELPVYNENSSINHPNWDPDYPIPSQRTFSFTLQGETEIKIRCDLEDQGGVADPNYTYNYTPLGRLRKISPTSQNIYTFLCPETYHVSENYPPYDWLGQGAERTLKEKTYILQAGSYEFEAYTPPKNQITSWRLLTKNNEIYASGMIDGGGIRVKEIKTDAKTRKFNYPTGLMLVDPSLYYIRKNELLGHCETTPLGYRCPYYLVQSSDPEAALSTFNNGNIVGYDWVEEYLEDTSNNISKTKYTYFNNTENNFFSGSFHPFFPYTYPNSPRYINYTNGLIQSIEKYKNNDLVEKTDFSYKTTSYLSTTGRTILAFRNQGKNDSGFGVGDGYMTRNLLSPYYYNPEWPLKSKEVNTLYMDNGSQIVSEKHYDYNTRDLLTKQRSVSPDLSEIETNLKYAHEKNNQLLISKNMIGIPLESSTLKKKDSWAIGELLSKTETIYSAILNLQNDIIAIPVATNTYDIANNSPTTEIKYDRYDTNGNLLQYTSKNGISTSIIWDLGKTMPIAKIDGATYPSSPAQSTDISQALIDSIVNASDYTSSTYTEANLLSQLDAFRKNPTMVNYQVSTFTYKPLIGVSTITPPSGIREIYKYDTANRLQAVVDIDGKILKEYSYKYKQ